MALLYSDSSSVASVAIDTLSKIGITPCFVGGMACKLYGNGRIPQVRKCYALTVGLRFTKIA